MKCDLCHRYGHRREFCWEDNRNSHPRPEGWRSILPSVKSTEDDDVALVSFNHMNIEGNISSNDDFLPIDAAPILNSNHCNFQQFINKELLRLQEDGVLVSNEEMSAIDNNDDEAKEDNVTISSISPDEAASMIPHRTFDVLSMPNDHLTSHDDFSEDLYVSVFPHVLDEATGTVDLHEAFTHQPF